MTNPSTTLMYPTRAAENAAHRGDLALIEAWQRNLQGTTAHSANLAAQQQQQGLNTQTEDASTPPSGLQHG